MSPATTHYDYVLKEIRQIYRDNYQQEDIENIQRVFFEIIDLFAGRWEEFQRCDTRYHDLQHTMQAVIPMAQIMAGWNRSGQSPGISTKFFELGIIAVLLHDTGYIKRREDDGGTGAKYTFRHVQGSIKFAEDYLTPLGYSKEAITSVQNMISCTGVQINLAKIEFSCREEQIVGFSLGTADLLGQMAADNYIEKLPYLFEEFREGYKYEGVDKLKRQGITIFENADQLIKDPPHFYENVVKNRLKDMGSVYEFLAPGGRNRYFESIEKNIRQIKSRYY